MTAQRTYDYISKEIIVKNTNSRTEIKFSNNKTEIGFLLKADQNIEESLQTNKCLFKKSNNELISIDGELVISLQTT